MKTATTALINHLAGNDRFLMADLYTFALLDGTVLHYTDAAQDLTWGGVTWSGSSVLIERNTINTKVGLDVDKLEVDIYPRSTDLVDQVPVLQAGVQGRLDGATVTLQRLFMAPFGTGVGTVPMFVGRIADATYGRTKAAIQVNSLLEILNIQMPRRLYQPGCSHALFDASCGLTKAAWGVAGSITSIVDPRNWATTLTQPDGYFALGTLTMTSGAANGLSRAVQASSLDAGGAVQLGAAFPVLPAVGDTFTAYPGCDKTLATCTAKFGNQARFAGYPYIPAPETAY